MVTPVVSKFKVTEPEVPPPVKPVPAVTPVISPGLAATQARPLVVLESILRIYPLVVAAVNLVAVSAPVPTNKSPLASISKVRVTVVPEPPPARPLPAVTVLTADADVNTTHAEPLHAYMLLSVVLK